MAKEGTGVGLATLSIGLIFVYGGIKGYSPLKTVQNIIQGHSGSTAQSQSSLTAIGGSNSGLASGSPVGTLASYNHSQLMQLWTQNGGDPSAANNAACHAIQESGGRPGVTSTNPDGGINVGLWQLDTKGKGAGYSVPQLQDPNTNAKVAIQGSSNGRDWSAWATPGC